MQRMAFHAITVVIVFTGKVDLRVSVACYQFDLDFVGRPINACLKLNGSDISPWNASYCHVMGARDLFRP